MPWKTDPNSKRQRLIAAIRELGPCTCREALSHANLLSPASISTFQLCSKLRGDPRTGVRSKQEGSTTLYYVEDH